MLAEVGVLAEVGSDKLERTPSRVLLRERRLGEGIRGTQVEVVRIEEVLKQGWRSWGAGV